MIDLLAIKECPLKQVLDEGIWVEARDKDPADEDSRQINVVNKFKRDHRQIAVHAVPNGGRQTDWARIRGERMGVVAGWPDLQFDWLGGEALVEMKDGQELPRRNQVDCLNRLHRMGKHVAVCRTYAGVIIFLRQIGAPVG